MIELKEDDIIYKLAPEVVRLDDVQIPENATVFDATNCQNFYDLKGLAQYPKLRVLLLKNTAIDSLDFSYISTNVEDIDVRQCRYIRSFQRFPLRKDKPLHVFTHFMGETILKTVPSHVDLEMEGIFRRSSRHRRSVLIENVKTYE